IAYVLVKRLRSLRRGIKIQPAARSEIKRPRRDFLWRPGVKPPPLIRPGLEHLRLGQGVIRIAFEKMTEKSQLHIFPIELRSLRVEADVPQLVPIFSPPI